VASEWTQIRAQCALFEDDSVLVLDKPAGISVIGERHGTDLLRLAADAGEKLMPVHRIDKVTSGVVLLAKSTPVHGGLTRQFARRTVEKGYLALTRSTGLPARGTIDLPLVTASSGRIRVAAERSAISAVSADSADSAISADRAISADAATATATWSVPPEAVFTHVRSFPSVTTFATVWDDGQNTLLALRPVTGRRHQIRVHLAWIGHPIEGDPLFDKTATARGARTLLHAWRLGFDAEWRENSRTTVEAEPGEDFWAPVRERLPDAVLDSAHRLLAALPARHVAVTDAEEATAEM
jgi:tRNA pseudouridine32 synthase/23S rRNA pseudouridine746 synthase